MVNQIMLAFPDAKIHSGYARVKCPYHKNGKEKNASMGILLEDRSKMKAGTCHCFTCGVVVPLEQLLKDKGITYKETLGKVPEVKLKKLTVEKALYKPQLPFRFSNYLESRGIGEKVQELFKVYEKEDKVYIPVFDRDGRLLYTNARSTVRKEFYIQETPEKTLWGIEAVDFTKPIAICESQIDAMSLWEVGIQAVATLGADNMTPLKELLSATSTLILAFDPDEAGERATKRTLEIFGTWRCNIIKLPEGIDINQALQDINDKNRFLKFITERTVKA